MNSPPHSRALALLLSVVPGWGHVYLGRERAGLSLFTLVALCAFTLVNILLVYPGDHRLLLARIFLGAALFIWLLSVVDVFRRTSPGRLKRIEEEKAGLLRAGMVAYLRRDLQGAEDTFRGCLRLDSHEVEALMRLGVVAARRGARRRARRYLRRARRLDIEEKWRWEVESELRALREPPRIVRSPAISLVPPRLPGLQAEGEDAAAGGMAVEGRPAGGRPFGEADSAGGEDAKSASNAGVRR